MSRATTGATDWADVDLAEPYHVPPDADPAMRDTMMSGYMTACDATLGAYVQLSMTLAEDEALQDFG